MCGDGEIGEMVRSGAEGRARRLGSESGEFVRKRRETHVLLGTGQFLTRRAPWLYPAVVVTSRCTRREECEVKAKPDSKEKRKQSALPSGTPMGRLQSTYGREIG